MIFLSNLLIYALVASPLPLAGYAAWFARRAQRRNASGACGHCGGQPYAAGTFIGPSLIQGRLVCSRCATQHRRRIQAALYIAGGITAAGVTAAVIVATTAGTTLGLAAWALPLIVLTEYSAMFGGAIVWMKKRNRIAHRALAAELSAGSSK